MKLRTNKRYRRDKAHAQRGVLAIFAGAALFFVVALGLAITELGFNAVHSFEAHNSSEAVAMTGGLVVLSQASPWNAGQVPTSLTVFGNSRSTENYASFGFSPPGGTPNGPAVTPQSAPGILESVVQGPLTSFGSLLQQPAKVGGAASSAVYQFQVNQLVPVYSRIVLVLDYSKSMRLYFTGYTENSGSGLTVLREAVNDVITSPSLNSPVRVNWGLVEFAGQPDPNPVPPITITPQNPYITQAQANAQVATMQQHLQYGTGTGMTDMADAVDSARALLDAGNNIPNNPYLGKGVIIIISDGEPDYVPGVTDDSLAGYQTRVNQAEALVQQSVYKAWANGYQTIGFTVLTNSDGEPSASLTQFMQSITGNSDGKQTSEPQYAHTAQQPSDVATWLNSINPVTHCLAKQAMNLSSSNWMNFPGTADNIYGYYVAGGAADYVETSVARSHDPNNMDPVFSNNAWTNTQWQFWWDDKYKLVELNSTMCQVYLQQQNLSPPPSFRLRWGVPRIYQTAKM